MTNKKSALKIVWTIIRIIVPLGLIGWLIAQVDWNVVWPLVKSIPAWSLACSAILYTLSHVVTAFRWNYLLRFQGVRIPYFRLLGLVFVGMFTSNFLPTTIGGDVVKMVGAAKGRKKRGVIVASVVADRFFNLTGMTIMLPLALTLHGISLLGSTQKTFLPILGLTGWPALRERLIRTWRQIRTWFTSPICIVLALALSWTSVGLSFGSFWMITLGLRIPITYWQASASSLLTYFLALIPVAINGLGIQEGSLTYLLSLQGASLEQATAAAFLIRLVTMVVSLAGGLRLLWGWRDLIKTSQDAGREISGESEV